MDVMKRIQNRDKLAKPEICPEEVHRLMTECWKLDRNLRASASHIYATLVAICDSAPEIRELKWPAMDADVSNLTVASPGKEAILIDLTAPSVLSSFQSLEIDPTCIKMGKELGRGEFGTVHLAKYSQTKAHSIDIAVKALLQSADFNEKSQFEYESKLLSAMSHRNIVRVVGVCFRKEPNMLALELMRGGDLKNYLIDHAENLKENSKDQLTGVCIQIADAMIYLASHRVIHRDLAAR